MTTFKFEHRIDIGQHIHLVWFDVTSSDGSGNGFNYEDGTFSPDEVIERIHAIRKQNACIGKDSDTRDGSFTCPAAKASPILQNARRPDHNPTLVCRRRAQQQQNRPHAAHSVYPRSLWTIESSTDRSLCWFGDRLNTPFGYPKRARRWAHGRAMVSTSWQADPPQTVAESSRISVRVRRLPARL